MASNEKSISASKAESIDRWLTWAIRVVVVVLAAALVLLGVYFVRQLSVPKALSPIDREIEAIESEIRARPADPQIRVAVANLYFEKGRYDDASAQARQVLNSNPEDAGALLVLGKSFAQKGQIDPAITYMSKAIQLTKDNPMAKSSLQLALAYQYVGSLYLKQGKNEEADEQFRRSLEIDRSNADTLHLAGKALAALGRFDDAIPYYLQALRFVPDFPEVYGDLARAYDGKGDKDGALFAWGMVNYSLSEYDQAMESLQQATRALPQMAEAHLGLAMAYEKVGRSTEALDEYHQALAIDGSSIAARQGIIRLGGKP